MLFSKSNQLECEIWKVQVCEGMMAALHSDFYQIIEMHIPSLNASLNIDFDKINVFTCNKDRYNVDEHEKYFGNMVKKPQFIKKVILSKELSEQVRNIVESYQKLEKNKEESFVELKLLLKS